MKHYCLVLLATLWCATPDLVLATSPPIVPGPESVPAGNDPLIGKWSWVWGGVYGIDPGAVLVILDIEGIEPDGKLRGKETVFVPGDQETTFDLGNARAWNQDGKRHVEVSRGPINKLIWYSLVLEPEGQRLQGTFSKPSWTTDEVVFVRQQ
jgi:hypothetical protein